MIIKTRWLKILSIGVIIWGIFLFLESFVFLSTGVIGDMIKQLKNYHYLNKEEINQITWILRRNSIIQLIVSFFVIIGGFGLSFRKIWAWFLTLFLSIGALVYIFYRAYKNIFLFKSKAWHFFPIILVFISIIIVLIKSVSRKKTPSRI